MNEQIRSRQTTTATSIGSRRVVLIGALACAVVTLSIVGSAQGKGPSNDLRVQAAEFDPQKRCDAKATWTKGIGLFAPNDAFAYALVMHKLCSTETNAASFGLISGVKGQTLIGSEALGFDYKNVNGGFVAHCGAGAPRFNVSMSDGSFHFIGGCANGTQTPDTPATGWTRVRFDPQNASQAFPPVPTNATIVSIALVFDEGPETDPNGSPEIVLDNIFVNGRFASRP
jgi:hypothetical protein